MAKKLISVLMLLLCHATTAFSQDITLNFRDADIHSVVKFVSEFSGKNFLVDQRVKGTVTVISQRPVPADAAYAIFLSVLEVNGFAAVETGEVIKIVPAAEAKQKGVQVLREGSTREGDDLVTKIMTLQFADAQQLVAILRPLLSPQSHLVSYPSANVLLITDSAINVSKIETIIQMLDVKNDLRVEVRQLKYAAAESVAKLLSTIYGQASKKSAAASLFKALSHEPGNFLIISMPQAIRDDVNRLVSKLDVSGKESSGNITVRYLKHADAEAVAKVISTLLGGTGPVSKTRDAQLFSGKVKVVAEPATNALLITADHADRQSLHNIIDQLDIRRLQVLVEAMIVEVTGDVGEQLGIEWLSKGGVQNFGAVGLVGAAAVASQVTSLAGAATAAQLQGVTSGYIKGNPDTGVLSWGAILRALETKTSANVLSTPNIMTMDNEEAEIIVGQNVPFLTGQNATQGGTANPFQTIERKDIGLTLRVKPQISEGDMVRLELYQEISSISQTATGVNASDLITNKRSIRTVALAKENQVLVLGGLMREDSSTSVRRTPCIGAIPLIGEPFKSTDNMRTKTNLMVFLRPTIIRNDVDSQSLTQQKYDSIKKLYEQPTEGGTLIYPQPEKKMPDSMKPAPSDVEQDQVE